ncbi:MAG: MmgE/PrpD family protein [Oceanicaulis sp.]
MAENAHAAERFTEHVLGLQWSDVSASAQADMKHFLLDTLAVGIAGRKAWLADHLLYVAKGWGKAGAQDQAAHVFASAGSNGEGERLPVSAAAYVNGFQIHCQEYDCVHEPAVVHPMAVICAALTAEAEASGASGADYLAAMVGAVDVAAGLGAAVQSPIRFFRPATAGLFGATLGVARLRGATKAQALDALGYALSQAAGTMQAHVEGKPALPVQIAGAARAAIVANDLAFAGFPGPHDVFEGPYGYLSLFEEQWEIEPVLAALGETFRIEEVSYKPFPTGRAAQGGIVMMKQLRADGVKASDVERITLTAPPLIHRLVGRPVTSQMQINYARLCFAYSGAVALSRGAVGLSDFTEEALEDPDILRLAESISVEIDEDVSDPARFGPQTLRAELKSGKSVTARIDALYGSPADPMTPEDVAAKRAECLAFGFGGARPDLDRALSRAVWLAPSLEDAGVIARLAAGDADALKAFADEDDTDQNGSDQNDSGPAPDKNQGEGED